MQHREGRVEDGACSRLTVSQFNVAIIFVAAAIKVEMPVSVCKLFVICHCRDMARIAVCQFNNPKANYILEREYNST